MANEDEFLSEGDVDFAAVEEAGGYGRYSGSPTVEEIDRFFVLDDEDMKLIGKRRRDSSRLGFALQLTTVRFVGTFVDDPIDVPTVVIDDLAAQLGIADPSCVKRYVERDNTKWEHRRQIIEVVGWRDYADVSCELSRWLDRRAWNTGESSHALFHGAIRWLRQRKVLLPGITTLTEDVRRARRVAEERLWTKLVDQITTEQANCLLRPSARVHVTR